MPPPMLFVFVLLLALAVFTGTGWFAAVFSFPLLLVPLLDSLALLGGVEVVFRCGAACCSTCGGEVSSPSK